MAHLGWQSIKVITFDATNTLLKFRRPPTQVYLEFARAKGLQIEEGELNQNFRKQWTKQNLAEPHFGKCWRTWWKTFVVNTLKSSDPRESESNKMLYDSVALELIEYFETDEAWTTVEGAAEVLRTLTERRANTAATDPFGGMFRELQYFKHPVIGVISNFDPRLKKILKGQNLMQYLDFCLLSHEARYSKPSAQLFYQAMRQWKTYYTDLVDDLEMSPDEGLHIGNSYSKDFVGATSVGWNAILIQSPDDPESQVPKSDQKRSASDPPLVIMKDLNELITFFEKNLDEICYS